MPRAGSRSVVEEEVLGSDSEEDPDFDFDFEDRPRSGWKPNSASIVSIGCVARCLFVPLPPPRTFVDLAVGRFVRWSKAKGRPRCYSDGLGELQPSKFQISESGAPIDAIPKSETAILPNNDDGDGAVRTSVVRGV